MRERLAEMLRSLAGLALICAGTGSAGDVNARRRLISQQVADQQGFIGSLKFEPGTVNSADVERLTGDAQSVFLVLLAIARDESGLAALPGDVREATVRLGTDVATALAAMSERVKGREGTAPIDVNGAMGDVERSISAHGELDEGWQPRLALYRELVVAVKRLAQSEPTQSAGLSNTPSSVRVRPCSSGRG